MKRFVLALVLFAGIVLVFGCADVRDDEVEQPWAQPEPWEKNMGIGPLSPD